MYSSRNTTRNTYAACCHSLSSCTSKSPISSCKAYFPIGLNCRIPCHLFACHWIRIASIVLCFVLQRTLTNETMVVQSGGVFSSCSHCCFSWGKRESRIPLMANLAAKFTRVRDNAHCNCVTKITHSWNAVHSFRFFCMIIEIKHLLSCKPSCFQV